MTFDNLVDAAIDRLDEEHRRSSASVPIIAHSFGGQLATAMTRRIPERIASLTLLTCPPDLPISFERIALRFAALSEDSPLRDLLHAYQRSNTVESLWPLIGAVFATPNFIDSLWGPDSGSIRDQLRWVTHQDSFIDAATFQQGLDDFLRREKPGSAVPFSRRVHIISGSHDKYADPEVDFKVWLRQFPAAVSSTYPIGHFPQLELPHDRWMPTVLYDRR